MLMVDWTSMLFMVTYIILLFPASYLMDRVGLRGTCLIGCIGTCVGSWIKVFSVQQDRFYVTFVGQALIASCQITVMTGPARLSAYWFGPEQVASAVALSCFGASLGIATFFLSIPMIVKNHDNLEDIGKDLSTLFWGVAIFCTCVTIAMILCKWLEVISTRIAELCSF